MSSVFAPKDKKKPGPKNPYKQPSSSKADGISLDQVKDYRQLHDFKAKKTLQKKGSPTTSVAYLLIISHPLTLL